ncbi:thrombospondin type 3 repeat-containing protein [Mariniflexile litorale]|uniref:Thrombospondin type 3 repeat-containing protein n=1 Tax=Mariniflexile litorale TaxID=3045158 RepID=A0AAU7EB40_9FLAO|nr:thrombospondin type 3 repeat-containing protein [Mariniflexile sp. KMM 9835]MDQ8210549.1 thrombospondin type 3 repeat-containing protein [Mariniflexile sp. KMM 9835]
MHYTNKKAILKSILVMASFCSITQYTYAQYPTIPDELQAKTDAVLAKEDQRLQDIWESNYHIIEEEALLGRPYTPWASYPKELMQADIPAFPGAQGGGAFTQGGRGGKIFVVTSLEDSGKGTFREAVEAVGARTIVFNISGIIRLKKPLNMRAPYVTIAGQTAPGDGVCIAGETFSVDTHDVIIRHMRFRRGETDVTRRDDAVGGNVVGNFIMDHCSTSWGLDENMSMYRHMYKANEKSERQKLPSSNVTIQNSISSEALDTYNHSFGSTIGGHNSTFMRNLWADNTGRNCSNGMSGDFNFVNNVVFNWWHRTIDGGDQSSMFNIINNYFKPGPITPTDKPIRYRILKPETGYYVPKTYGRAYVSGNFMVGSPEVTANNWNGGVQVEEKALAYIKQAKPFRMPQFPIMKAEEAYEFVLNNVGATLPKRDAVDTRIIKQVRTGKIEYKEGLENTIGSEFIKRRLPADSYKQGIITSPDQVGGYPDYKGKPYKDSDNDGMSDAWEKKYGLNPKDASDANKDLNGDGYTNIEKYINGIDPTKKVDWTKPDNNIDTLAKLQNGILQ